MTQELQQKFKEKACDYCRQSGAGCGHIDRDGSFYQICNGATNEDFFAGATAMYAELAPLVEWVDVNERLPEREGRILIKFCSKTEDEKDVENIGVGFFCKEWAGLTNMFLFGVNEKKCTDIPFRQITHWRKIE